MKGWRGFIVVAALGAGLATARPARADVLEDAGWGSLTVLTNVVYMPVKLAYALLGGLTGGLAYGLTAGDLKTAQTVWETSMGGNYVITPRMLRGEDAIAFSGTPGATESANDDGGKDALQEEQLSDR